MNKLGSTQTLVDFISNELSWRKRELTTIKFMVDSARRHEKDVLVRSGICMLYAHWEGFVKNAATAYLNYVYHQGLTYKDLNLNFVALCMRSKFRALEHTNKVVMFSEVTSLLLSQDEEKATIPWQSAIDAHDNLNSDVLSEVLHVVGIDDSSYIIKKGIIDERLLKNRNSIAHGDFIFVDVNEYILLHNDMLSLIDRFRNDIENAAVTAAFIRTHP